MSTDITTEQLHRRLNDVRQHMAHHVARHFPDSVDPLFNDADELGAAVGVVLDLHNPMRIYGECGHQHQAGEPGVQSVENVGTVCEDGYLYTICQECCTDGGEHQTEHCCDNHTHEGPAACYPCNTLLSMAQPLGAGLVHLGHDLSTTTGEDTDR